MDIKEYTQKLVEAETVDDRLAIAEEHMKVFESNVDSKALVRENEELRKSVESKDTLITELDSSLKEQKSKFIDRFFGDEGEDIISKDDKEETATKTLADLGYGVRSY